MRNEYPQPRSLASDNTRQPNDLSHENWSVQMYGKLTGDGADAQPAMSWHRGHPPDLLARRA